MADTTLLYDSLRLTNSGGPGWYLQSSLASSKFLPQPLWTHLGMVVNGSPLVSCVETGTAEETRALLLDYPRGRDV